MIYLDYAATTPVDEDILETYIKVLKNEVTHPWTISPQAKRVQNIIDQAKESILKNIFDNSAQDYDLSFTATGTEANNLAIMGYAKKFESPKHWITTNIEHGSVQQCFKELEKMGHEVTYIGIDENGLVDIDKIINSITDKTVMVSIICVNNEIGVIQNIQKINKLIKQKNDKTVFMTDFVQGMGKVDIDIIKDIDILTISSHKLYAPKGAGAVIFKKNTIFSNIIFGHDVNNKYRPGTPNVPAIVSFAHAVKKSLNDFSNNQDVIIVLNKYLKKQLEEIDGVIINTPNENIIYNVINVSIMALKPEIIVNGLGNEDIVVSTMSACSSKSESKSKIIYELTKDEERSSKTLRISISHHTTKDELNKFIECLKRILKG